MSKVIRINEEQYLYYIKALDVLNEGVNWNKNDDGSIDFSINTDNSDKSNLSGTSVDTRVFGTKNDILHGDGTLSKNSKTLHQNYINKQGAIKMYQSLIDYIRNGRKGELYNGDDVDTMTKTTIYKWLKDDRSDNRIMTDALKSINRIKGEGDVIFNTYDRVSQSTNDKVARYKTGTVPSTNVKYIALFAMSDFNFSDAIKNGNLRQNGNTDKILNINKDDRSKTSGMLDNIPLTYDGNKTPDIKQNFSLKNTNKYHDKQQYEFGDKNYTSINQFIDKSIMYASYALKEENFKPDYIIAAPSSSKFNVYYCTNLSKKMGIPFVNDFFQRNIINVKFDGNKDTQELLKQGFSEKDVLEFESGIKNMAYTEIAHIISEPMKNFIKQYSQLFYNISATPKSRTKASIVDVYECMMLYSFQTIINSNNSDDLTTYLTQQFMLKKQKLQRSYDSKHIHNEVIKRINMKIGIKRFNDVLIEIQKLIKQYETQIIESGYKLNFKTKKFKITKFPKRLRPFLHDVYIVADQYTNNGKLLSRYKNGKFLIFDEDINSGATLKLAIDALEDKLATSDSSKILCLVNAQSSSGF